MKPISVVIEPYGTDVILSNSEQCQTTLFSQAEADQCFSGTIYTMFKLLFEIADLNFTVYRAMHFYPENTTTDVWALVEELMKNQKVQFNAAIWGRHPNRDKYFHILQPSIFVRKFEYVLIEKERNFDQVTLAESIKFSNVFDLLDWEIWATLAGFVLLFSLLISLAKGRIDGKELMNNAESILRIVLDQANLEKMPKIGEWLLFLWSFTAVVIMACFTGLIYMKTTVQPGWVQPFWDLESMRDAGYRYVSGN